MKLLIVLLLLFSCATPKKQPEGLKIQGDGTEKNPYIIGDIDAVNNLAYEAYNNWKPPLVDIPDNYAYPCDESDCLDCNCSLLMTTPCPQHGGWGEPIRPNGNVKCKHIWVEIYGTENAGRLQGCAFVVCVKCYKEETQDREGPIRIKLIDASK